jgi:hypothetical protein
MHTLFYILVIITAQANSQDVHISYQEDIILDVAACENGISCGCPEGSEYLILNGDMPVCSSSSQYVENKRSMVETEEILSISFTISLALKDDQKRDYNLTLLIDEVSKIEYTYLEFFALDIDEANEEVCPQGYNNIWLTDYDLLQISACPFRLINTYPYTLTSIADFAFSSTPILCEWGNFHMLVEQENMICIPCFPGTFCDISYSKTSIPSNCPLGTYTPLYGQQMIGDCLLCPFEYQTKNVASTSFEDCIGADMRLSLLQSFILSSDNHNSDTQNLFKTKLFQSLIDTLNIEGGKGLIHILEWEL